MARAYKAAPDRAWWHIMQTVVVKPMQETKADFTSQIVGLLAALVSLCFFCVGVGAMFSHGDTRLTLTVADTFGGLREIRDIFRTTANFSAAANPVGLGHVPYPSGPETLWELEDLERRGLISSDALALMARNVSMVADDPSLLRRVLRLAWCTAWPGTTALPADRTPGCRCIANAYLDFVNVTGRPANGTVNVSGLAEHRERVADRVFRCWDQRQVRRSRACGNVCKTQVVGLPMFANLVMFLACISYVVYSNVEDQRYSIPIKLMLLVLAVVSCVPYYAKYPESNSFNLVGVAVSLLYIMVSLNYELGEGIRDKAAGSALMACVMVNLPLIMSAHAIQFGVSGYGRDVWASVSFGVCGGVIGLLFQVPSPFLSPVRFLSSADTRCVSSVSSGRIRSGSRRKVPALAPASCSSRASW